MTLGVCDVDKGVCEWVGSRVQKSISYLAIKIDVRLYTKPSAD